MKDRLRASLLALRKLLAAVFVPTDTTWNHCEHFRSLFRQHLIPLVVDTDGLSLFGHDSMADDRDPCSELQRAFAALGVTHLVAPSPQAKGKIERRFGTLQQRLVAILAYEKVGDYAAAQRGLNREVERQNATVCRTTGRRPNDAWEKALAEQRTVRRPCPPEPASGTAGKAARQRRPPNRLSGPELAHRPNPTRQCHPHLPSPTPVLGDRSTSSSTP